jgi:SAM-dependent methyltransferase
MGMTAEASGRASLHGHRLATFTAVLNERPPSRPRHGQDGISEALRLFTDELPYERGPILDFATDVAHATAPGASVLDLGAGNAPYRELFAHTRYATNDWTQSVHSGADEVDIVGSADSLPVADSSFDLVLCTQVLEHTPEPAAVLAECFRVLAPGGRIALSVPLLWELHELPHDYFRYTAPGLRHLLTKAGFSEPQVEPRSDGFTAIAQLLDNLSWAMGDPDDGLSELRAQARATLHSLAEALAPLAPLDSRKVMPLGYTALAFKP